MTDRRGHVEHVVGGKPLSRNHRLERRAERIGGVQDSLRLTGRAGCETERGDVVRAPAQPLEHRAEVRFLRTSVEQLWPGHRVHLAWSFADHDEMLEARQVT